MNAATPRAFRETHSIAGGIHLAMSEAGMTTTQVAIASGESESFIKGVLVGEDGLDRLINVAFLKKIANATGRDIRFVIYRDRPAKRRATVKSGGGS